MSLHGKVGLYFPQKCRSTPTYAEYLAKRDSDMVVCSRLRTFIQFQLWESSFYTWYKYKQLVA